MKLKDCQEGFFFKRYIQNITYLIDDDYKLNKSILSVTLSHLFTITFL